MLRSPIYSPHTRGKSRKSSKKEFGLCELEIKKESELFSGIREKSKCWMSHNDHISNLPDQFEILASTDNCQIAAMASINRKIYALQYHPEVEHTEAGKEIFHNFLYKVCQCKGDWTMSSFLEESIPRLREQLAGKKVLCAFSGGVDSSVAALMVHKAIGDNLHCIFVDHGLLRLNEAEQVEEVFSRNFAMNIKRVNAGPRFLAKLKNIVNPETKRKIIGEEFIRVFEEEAKKISDIDCLVQGTIYPDIVESGEGEAALIKSHHNVGGLPENMQFHEICEPLRNLFKDEVREVGKALGIPHDLVWRQPFPGPGLAVRIIGEVTFEKVEILQKADAIFRDEIFKAGLAYDINQYFAVLTDMRSVGVMGDSRTYDYTLALRAVTTADFMTANWARIPYEVLERVSNRIINEASQINRIVYDITSKPPATIEWE